MRRQVLVGALGAALLLGGGCGIPASSDVRVDGKGGTATEAGSINGQRSEPPTRTASGSDIDAFVRNFLAAAAGEPDRAYERVKLFVAPEHQTKLQEKKGSEVALNVVRLGETVFTGNSDSTTTVKIKVQQLGLLRANGTLAPPVATETGYEFRVRSAVFGGDDERAGLYVLDPPNVLLLSDNALQRYYQDESIYFWSSDGSRLVPDQRYLPMAVPDERRVNEVVKWLVGGPSDWLRPGVVGLPDRTELVNNATGANNRWEVNLDMSGDDQTQIDRLITQLAWSLGDLRGELELKVRNNSQPVQDLQARRDSEPLYPIREDPQRFGVYEGAIRPLDFAGEPSGDVPLSAEVNRNIVSRASRGPRAGSSQRWWSPPAGIGSDSRWAPAPGSNGAGTTTPRSAARSGCAPSTPDRAGAWWWPMAGSTASTRTPGCTRCRSTSPPPRSQRWPHRWTASGSR